MLVAVISLKIKSYSLGSHRLRRHMLDVGYVCKALEQPFLKFWGQVKEECGYQLLRTFLPCSCGDLTLRHFTCHHRRECGRMQMRAGQRKE